jgi:membrane protease YdiL (CAAX protease family)
MASTANTAEQSASAPPSYWEEAARPLASLAFVAPILLIYEVGVLVLGPQALRNGADVWLRQLLDLIGFGQYFLLPVLTCAILAAWHHTSQQQWRVRCSVLGGMGIESMAFGFLLLAVAQLQASLFSSLPAAFACSAGDADGGHIAARLVGYCGAGIYEELLFRLMLLPAAMVGLRWAGASRRLSIVLAVAITSVLFSAAHYEFFTHSGYAFDWFSFLFRCVAGVCFSALFLLRGFGIAAGAHALYDVYAVVLH